ncbi:PEGA domain-containing protein [Candidatus Curtissbacteria bacterium]|nr:PEGA domain-containing protein [Candidatus Curtissbacteria bacterium]
MPSQATNDKRLKTKVQASLNVFTLVVSLSSLVLLLSGCSAIGIDKPAALQVTSKPEAAIFLDGKHVGKTPFFSDQLKAGDYSLKISVSEASFVDKISLRSGTLTVVNRELASNFLGQAGESLALISGQKGLFVTSMPTDANVTVDGKLAGLAPQLITAIDDGDHKVLVEKDGYTSREFSIKTTSSFRLLAEVTLASQEARNIESGTSPAPEPQTSKVEVTQTPQGFLRLRQDASTSSPEIGRVKTGDQLEVIQETQGWIKVKFPASQSGGQDKQGWVSADYTKKL